MDPAFPKLLSLAVRGICDNEINELLPLLDHRDFDPNARLFDRYIFDELYDDDGGPQFETLAEMILFIMPESTIEMLELVIARGGNMDLLDTYRFEGCVLDLLLEGSDPNLVVEDLSAVFTTIVRAKQRPFPQEFFNKVLAVASRPELGLRFGLNLNFDEAIFLLLSKGQQLPNSSITGQEQVLLYCLNRMGMTHLL